MRRLTASSTTTSARTRPETQYKNGKVPSLFDREGARDEPEVKRDPPGVVCQDGPEVHVREGKQNGHAEPSVVQRDSLHEVRVGCPNQAVYEMMASVRPRNARNNQDHQHKCGRAGGRAGGQHSGLALQGNSEKRAGVYVVCMLGKAPPRDFFQGAIRAGMLHLGNRGRPCKSRHVASGTTVVKPC